MGAHMPDNEQFDGLPFEYQDQILLDAVSSSSSFISNIFYGHINQLSSCYLLP
jgi:hypothetical protein